MSYQTKSLADIGAATIDSLEFAREGRALGGEVGIASLGRLADVVADASGSLRCLLQGVAVAQQRQGKAGLVLEVDGTLRLRCQRCLQPLDYPLSLTSRLLLVAPGEAWPEDDEEAAGSDFDDDWDAIEGSRELSVLELIEDEVLLALPIAPKHEACDPAVALSDEDEPSPFAVLAKLKQ